MPNYLAYVPVKSARSESSTVLGHVGQLYQEIFGSHCRELPLCGGTRLLLADDTESVQFYSDDRSWIAIKGVLYDTVGVSPSVSLSDLLGEFVEKGAFEWQRYEGSFALTAYDARRNTLLAMCDQAVNLHLYYGLFDGGFYVTTRPLFLARALKLPLDPVSMQSLLAQGLMLSPRTAFQGLSQLNLGEHVIYDGKSMHRERHWQPYAETRYRHAREAARHVAEICVDRARRIGRLRQPIVCDLTSGYDSRLTVCACHAAGVDFGVTVNGTDGQLDVAIAQEIATASGLTMTYFDYNRWWKKPIDEALRRELVYRTNGELVFTEAYHHSVTRPVLAERYRLHLMGGHGELLRYHPWAQEFFGIGRRRLANLDRLMRFRIHGVGPSLQLYPREWYSRFVHRLRHDFESVCTQVPHTLTNQQLDAVHAWKMTGHFGAYNSALSDWLPTTSVLSGAGYLSLALAISWKAKLTSQLMRNANYYLSPSLSRFRTHYGGTGAPARLGTLHHEVLLAFHQMGYLARKVKRVWRRTRAAGTGSAIPFVTAEFRAILNPDQMYSRRLYRPDGLRDLLTGNDADWHSRALMILRVATLEALCREVDFHPGADFLITPGEEAA